MDKGSAAMASIQAMLSSVSVESSTEFIAGPGIQKSADQCNDLLRTVTKDAMHATANAFCQVPSECPFVSQIIVYSP